MTKMIKMSLAAAVAVAGISTTASAMENTSFSGKLYVENIAKTIEKDGDTLSEMEIDFDLKAKTKITDTLSSVVRVEADAGTADVDSDGVSQKTSTPSVDLENAYFTYANMGAAVNMGRLYIDTPNTDGEIGEGLFATYTMGSVTAAAANYATNEKVTNGINAAAILGSAGPVNFEAWLVNIDGVVSNTTFVVGGAFGPVSAEVRVANSDFDAEGTEDGVTNKLVVSGKAGSIGITGIYFTTDEDGAAYVTDASSANAVELVNLTAKNLADADVMALVVSAPVSDKGTAIVKYGVAEVADGDGADQSELVLQYNHKLAESTTASVRYASFEDDVDDAEKTHARVDLTYKF